MSESWQNRMSNCNTCRNASSTDERICLIDHSQTATTDQGKIIDVSYFDLERGCPDHNYISSGLGDSDE